MEFANSDNLKAWLTDKPPEFPCILAVRAALRVLPLLNQALRQDAETRRGVLSCFRALEASCFMTAWPAREGEVQHNGRHVYRWANDTFTDVFNSAQSNLIEYTEIGEDIWPFQEDVRGLHKSGDVVHAATSCVLAAVDAVDAENGIASPDATPEAACKAISEARDAVYGIRNETDRIEEDFADVAEFWTAVEKDAECLAKNGGRNAHGTANVLFETKLWPDGIPVWAGRIWAALKDELPENEGWDVWIKWYESRLVGEPANEELEFERVTIQNDEWNMGPYRISKIIRKRVLLEETKTPESALSFLDEIRQKIASGTAPGFGGPLEVECRDKMKYGVEEVRTFLSEPASEHGNIGHNQPPEHLRIEEEVGREVIDPVEDLDRGVKKGDPDTVVEAATGIGKILKRIGTRLAENMFLSCLNNLLWSIVKWFMQLFV